MPKMPNNQRGTLFLVPNTLGKTPENNTIPDYVLNIIRRLDVLIVENIQAATRYLQWVGDAIPDYEIDFLLLNKNTLKEEAATFLRPLKQGRNAGLLSEAGCPVVADPGSDLIKMAHRQKIRVSPLVGPSSILLALMASGFNGQQFAFHGYLPINKGKRRSTLGELERQANGGQTQIFMEAPHRNNEMLSDIIRICKGDTGCCTATDITLPEEQIISKPIHQWKQHTLPDLHKRPTIFLLAR